MAIMNQRGTDTREQILKMGSHLVQTRGYSAMISLLEKAGGR